MFLSHVRRVDGKAYQENEVCTANSLVSGSINSTQQAHIDLRYLPYMILEKEGAMILDMSLRRYENDAFYRAECYFWCTEDGELPDPKPERNVDKDLLDRLVRHCIVFQLLII